MVKATVKRAGDKPKIPEKSTTKLFKAKSPKRAAVSTATNTKASPKASQKSSKRLSIVTSPKNGGKQSPKGSSPKNDRRLSSTVASISKGSPKPRASRKGSVADAGARKRSLVGSTRSSRPSSQKGPKEGKEGKEGEVETEEQKNQRLAKELEELKTALDLATMRGNELETKLDAANDANTALKDEVKMVEDSLKSAQNEVVRCNEAKKDAERSRENAIIAMHKAEEEAKKEKEKRETAVEEMEKAVMLAEEYHGKRILAETANRDAQEQTLAVFERDREISEILRVNEEDTKRIKAECLAMQDSMKAEIDTIRLHRETEKHQFTQRQERYQKELSTLEDQLNASKTLNVQLAEKLAEPRPALERLNEEIRGSCQYLLKCLRERLTEAESFRGGETLRWKLIKCKVELLTDQIGHIFQMLTPKIYERDSKIRQLTKEIASLKASHSEAEERSYHVEHDRNMLRCLFHPEPNLLLKTCNRPAALSPPGESSARRTVKTRKPVPMRARLLISAIRKEEVAAIVEKTRSWDMRCSTLLLSCCIKCGAFFLDTDMAWPCDCSQHNSLTMEHEEYSVFHNDELLNNQIFEKKRDGEI